MLQWLSVYLFTVILKCLSYINILPSSLMLCDKSIYITFVEVTINSLIQRIVCYYGSFKFIISIDDVFIRHPHENTLFPFTVGRLVAAQP